jgi:hypothetical protein
MNNLERLTTATNIVGQMRALNECLDQYLEGLLSEAEIRLLLSLTTPIACKHTSCTKACGKDKELCATYQTKLAAL